MSVRRPFHLRAWIDDNRDLLRPPVGNKNLYQDAGDYVVMVVGGPNARKDYHYNETEELFYQLEGDIVVRIQEPDQEPDQPVDIRVRQGEIFLLPARVPHSPIRPPDTVGLVIERKRDPEHRDGLLWYCESCNHELHACYFALTDIEKDFLPHFDAFYGSLELRTCDRCGTIMSP